MTALMPLIELGTLATGISILIVQAVSARRLRRLENESSLVRQALILICKGKRSEALWILAGHAAPAPDADAA